MCDGEGNSYVGSGAAGWLGFLKVWGKIAKLAKKRVLGKEGAAAMILKQQ